MSGRRKRPQQLPTGRRRHIPQSSGSHPPRASCTQVHGRAASNPNDVPDAKFVHCFGSGRKRTSHRRSSRVPKPCGRAAPAAAWPSPDPRPSGRGSAPRLLTRRATSTAPGKAASKTTRSRSVGQRAQKGVPGARRVHRCPGVSGTSDAKTLVRFQQAPSTALATKRAPTPSSAVRGTRLASRLPGQELQLGFIHTQDVHNPQSSSAGSSAPARR